MSNNISPPPAAQVITRLKELWQYAVFRWCVYVTPLLVFGLLLKWGYFYYRGTKPGYTFDDYHWNNTDYRDDATLIWFLIFALPAVWVWRKPLWRAIGFLNKKAD